MMASHSRKSDLQQVLQVDKELIEQVTFKLFHKHLYIQRQEVTTASLVFPGNRVPPFREDYRAFLQATPPSPSILLQQDLTLDFLKNSQQGLKNMEYRFKIILNVKTYIYMKTEPYKKRTCYGPHGGLPQVTFDSWARVWAPLCRSSGKDKNCHR